MDSKQKFRAALNRSTEIIFPTTVQETRSHLERWSDIGISIPFAIVVPADENEVVSIVKFAASEGLQIIAGGGGRGSYVPIGSNSLYVDLRKFNKVSVDLERATVTVGGGAKTGETSKACAEKGLYTLLPNANSVGVVGAALGGGSNPLNSIHGLAGDHLVSVDLVTADGKAQHVNSDSLDNEDGLLKILGRTGYGFGIITSLTLRTWPISGLNMKDDKVWVRTMVFPASAIDTVAKVYCKLQPPPPGLQLTIIISRPPKNPPEPGPPTIILSASFFGPEEEAEKAVALLLSSEVEKQAAVAKTASLPIQDLNNAAEPLNQAGQFKEMYTCMIKEITPSSISTLFGEFVRFGDDTEDARGRSYVVIGSWNPSASMRNSTERNDMIYSRDRGVLVQAVAWYHDINTKPAADQFGNGAMKVMQRTDEESGIAKMTLAHNLRLGQDLGESYSNEMVSDYLRLKEVWDSQDVFWSPVTDQKYFILPSMS